MAILLSLALMSGWAKAQEEKARDAPGAFELACGHARRGEIDAAFEALDRALEGDGLELHRLRTRGDLQVLHADPRFDELLSAGVSARVDSIAAKAQRAASSIAYAPSSRIVWQDGHSTVPLGLTFAPDAREMITWTDGGSVFCWDVATGDVIGMLGVHGSPALSSRSSTRPGLSSLRIRYGPDGNRVVIHDVETLTAELWDPVQEDRIGEFGSHLTVTDFDFMPDGSAVVTIDLQGQVLFYDPSSGEHLSGRRFWSGGAAWKLQVDVTGAYVVTNGEDGVARVFGAATGEELASFGTLRRPVYARLTDDRRRLVVFEHRWKTDRIADGFQWQGSERELGDGTVRLVELGQEPRVLIERRTELIPYRSTREGTCVDRAGTRLLTRSPESKRLEFWDVDTGELLASHEGDVYPRHAVDADLVAHVTETGRMRFWGPALAGEGIELPVRFPRRLRFGPGSARGLFWVGGDFGGQASELDPLDELGPRRMGWGYEIHADTHSSDGEFLAMVGYPDMVVLLETRAGGGSRFMNSHASQATGAAILSLPTFGDRAVVLSTADRNVLPLPFLGRPIEDELEGHVRLWDVLTGEDLGPLPGYDVGALGVSVSPDREHFAVFGGLSRSTVSIHGTSDLREVGRLSTGSQVIAAVFGTDGERLLTTHAAGGALLWDVTEGSSDFGRVVAEIPSATWAESNFHSPHGAMSSDGALLAVSTPSPQGSVEVRDGWSGHSLSRVDAHSELVRYLSFSPDVRWLLTCSKEVVLVDTLTFEPVASHSFGDSVTAAAWHPDSQRYVVGCDDGRALLFDVRGGEPTELHALGGAVTYVGFDEPGARVAVCRDDGIAHVWSVETAESKAILRGHAMGIKSAVFVPGTDRIVTVGRDATHRVWSADTGQLLQTRVTYESGEWLAFTGGDSYVGTERAADWARIGVNGRTYPLSSYAKKLYSPASVERAMSGMPPTSARLDEAPELIVGGPESGILRERSFDLDAYVSDRYGISEVRVWQDGEELARDRVEAALRRERGDRSARLSLSLSFPIGANETEVRVRAENRRAVLSRPRTVSVTYEAPRKGGDLYLVALAVEDFGDDELDLRYPIKDADDVIARFEEEAGDAYRDVHVRRLVDGEVTRGALSRLKDEFLWDAGPDDTLLVFVAGHGVRTRSGDYYFLTPGATLENPYDGIPRNDLYELVEWKGLEARRRMLLIDTCQAGDEYEGARGVALDDAFRQEEVDRARGAGLYIVAASTELGVAREERGNGLFTRALLDGLAGSADSDRDGWIDIGELLAYTREAVLQLSDKAQRPTMPRVEGGDPFRLARSRAGR